MRDYLLSLFFSLSLLHPVYSQPGYAAARADKPGKPPRGSVNSSSNAHGNRAKGSQAGGDSRPGNGRCDVSGLKELVVLSNGRQKPFRTYAREKVFRLLGSLRHEGKSSLETCVSILFRPQVWLHRKCLRTGGGGVFQRQKFVSPHQVLSKWEKRVETARRKRRNAATAGEVREEEAELRKFWRKIRDIYTKAEGFVDPLSEFRFLPGPAPESRSWLTLKEAETASRDHGPAALKAAMESFKGLRTSFLEGDSASFTEHAAELKRLQRQCASEAEREIRPEWMVKLENLYYRVDFRWAGLGVFVFAALLGLFASLAGRAVLSVLFRLAVVSGILWNLWIVSGHTVIAGRLPLKNLNEVYLVVLFFAPIIGLFLDRFFQKAAPPATKKEGRPARKKPLYSEVAAILTAAGFAGSMFLPPEGFFISPLVAILRSPWRQVHILSVMLSYAILLVAFALHLAFLVVVFLRRGAFYTPSGRLRYSGVSKDLDQKAYLLVLWGFLFLAVGVSTGAAWGNVSWGRYWGWDPKEVWAAVALAVYALFLHCRKFLRIRKELLALIGILGYAAILFTYFGVSYLLPGLHAYS